MPSLRDIKRRIKSVKNTRQITKAMKMVSAAKLKKAQDDIVAARPYAEKMQEFIASLAGKTAPLAHPLLKERVKEEGEPIKAGVFLFTSDRGLCGGFNTAMLRTADAFLREKEGVELGLYLVGKRAAEHFKRRDIRIIKAVPTGGARPNYKKAAETAKEAMRLFLSGELDEAYLIYSEFKSALTQRPVVRRLLPLAAARPDAGLEEGGDAPIEPDIDAIYEPDVAAVLADLLPKYVEVQVFRAFLESSASEHGARMTAMDSASKNASEMIGALTLKYNRLRQAAITKELMEIIGGAEALK